MNELFRLFVSRIPATDPPTTTEAQAAEAGLEQVLAAGQAAYPHFAVDEGFEERFAGQVARHMPPAPAEWAGALERLHGPDLYLAFACASQIPGALAAFEASCGSVIDGALRGRATSEFADDAKQLMREKLFIGDAEDEANEPRILSYAGRGPLAAWVAVSAQRTALSLRRTEASTRARHVAAAQHATDLGEPDLAGAAHPELAYLKRRYRGAFVEAFEAAFARLTDRERTLLRLHLVSRLRLDQIAPMFRVNTSTVSRWLSAARDSLLAHTREGLSTRLHVSSGEFASMARLLTSQIDVSLARLLAEDAPKD